MPTDAANPSPARVLVALSGGGAKGIIHVGALGALEEAGVVFAGLSGTSAGAIAATLKASDFTAAMMADPTTDRTLFDRLREIDPAISDATSLFGGGGWRRVRSLRWFANIAGRRPAIAGFALLALGVPGGVLLSGVAGQFWSELIAAAGALLLAALSYAVWRVLGGLARLDSFGDALDALLTRQIFPDEPGRRVCMADYGKDGRPALKIVASDLSGRRLALFSAERTPEVAVADAVVASIAIPALFRLPVIGGRTYADGGLVSNLPAWGFDEERELDPDTYTIAIDVADTAQPEAIGRRGWLGPAIRTAIFGSAELNLRAVDRAERITLGTDIGLLDFDLPKARYLKAASEARAAAAAAITNRLFVRPQIYRDACEQATQLFEQLFNGDPALLAAGRRTGRVRVALAIMDAGYAHSLRLRYGVGYEGCPDEGLLLPMEGSVAGLAFRSREAFVGEVPLPPELALPGPANAHRRALVWPALAWNACLPISNAPEAPPAFVVTIDGDEVLAPGATSYIFIALDAVGRVFEDVVVKLAALETV